MSANNEGLLCPECMQQFSNVALLTAHFEASHGVQGDQGSAKQNQSEMNVKQQQNQSEMGIKQQAKTSEMSTGANASTTGVSAGTRVSVDEENSKSQLTITNTDPHNTLSRNDETKTKPITKFAASLGDFITNFTIKSPLNFTPTPSGSEVPISIKESSQTDIAPNKNNKAERHTKLKDYCIHLKEQNKVLAGVLIEFYNIGEDQQLDDLQKLTIKYKEIFLALNQAKPLLLSPRESQQVTTLPQNNEDNNTKLKSISSELEQSKQLMEQLKIQHQDQLDQLKVDYDTLIANITENKDANEDDVKNHNVKLLQETQGLKQQLLSKESLLDNVSLEKDQIQKELDEKNTSIQTLTTKYTEEMTRCKSKLKQLVESGVKSRNEQKSLQSKLDELNKSLVESEKNKTQFMNDNVEVTAKLLETNEEITAKNKKLINETKTLSENYKQHQDKYNNLVSKHKKLNETHIEAQKLIETLKKSNANSTEDLDSIKLKLEKEIVNNGAVNKKINENKEKIKELTTIISNKDKQYNELVQTTKNDASNYRTQLETTRNKLELVELNNLDKITQYNHLNTKYQQMVTENVEEKTALKESKDQIQKLTLKLNTHDDYVNGLLDKISVCESQAIHLERKYQEGNLALCELDEENRKYKIKICAIYSRFWKNDDTTIKCQHCAIEFKFTKRKHHCRNCG